MAGAIPVGDLLAHFYSIADLEHLPEPKWLIDGLFEQDALVMLVGPPGSFKSFLAIDWALSLAAGRPWNKRAIKPSKVLYALGEGKASLLKRISAWSQYRNLSRDEEARLRDNFKVTFDVPQLAIPRDANSFMKDLEEDAFNPTCLVIDTLARSYVGKNENDAMDAGQWVHNVDRLRQQGMTVLVLHHSRKNTEFGIKYRGNTAWMGAMDTSFILERNPEGYKGLAKLSCDKQKDHQEPEEIWLQTLQIRPDIRTEGSIVLTEAERPGTDLEESRAQERVLIDEMISGLLQDEKFESDRARARVLASSFNLLEGTAQTKIARARKDAKLQPQIILEA